MFYILRGAISMHYSIDDTDRVERFIAGEMLCVPKAIEHRPVADDGTEFSSSREAVGNTGAVVDDVYTNASVRI